MRKGINYKREAFEKKFRWLNVERKKDKMWEYESELTQLAWEGWCAAIDHADKERRESAKAE